MEEVSHYCYCFDGIIFSSLFCEDVDIVLKEGMIAVGVHIYRNVRMMAPQTVQESTFIQFRC